MKQGISRWFSLAFLPAALLLAWPVAWAHGLPASSGVSSVSGGSTQQTPWQNQAQNLQQRLFPATGDMTLGGAATLSSGNAAGSGSSLSGGQGTGGTQPWANQAQQLQRRLAGGAPGSSTGISGLSMTGADGASQLSSIPAPSAGGGIANPYAGGVSVPNLGSAVPGADSPYTSTGNAAGKTPYRDPYGLSVPGRR